MDIYFIAGVTGATCILIAFIIGNYGDVAKRTKADELFNLVGSLLLLFYALGGMLWPFIILNSIWAVWSIWLLIPRKRL